MTGGRGTWLCSLYRKRRAKDELEVVEVNSGVADMQVNTAYLSLERRDICHFVLILREHDSHRRSLVEWLML